MPLNTFLSSNLGPIMAQLLESELVSISDNNNVDNDEVKALSPESTVAAKRAMAVPTTLGCTNQVASYAVSAGC